MRIRLTFAALLLATVCAHAQDSVPTWDWSGPYVGFHVNAGETRTEFSSTIGVLAPGRYGDGFWAFGAHAGYGRTLGGIYLGVEAGGQIYHDAVDFGGNATTVVSGGIGGSGIGGAIGSRRPRVRGSFIGSDERYYRSQRSVYAASPTTTSRFESFATKLEEAGSLTMRAGYPIGRVMPFVRAGVAAGHFKSDYIMLTRINGGTPFGEIDSLESVEVGYTVGGGVEFAVAPQISLRAEYAFTDFGDRHLSLLTRPDTVSLGSKLHEASLGVSFHF